MTSDAPGPGTPGPGGPPDDVTEAVPSGSWPAELVPPPAPAEALQAPVPPAQDPTAGTWGAPPQPAPAAPAAPAAPQWDAQPAAPAPAAQPQPWGAATPPPAGGGWGAAPAPGQPPAQPGGQWGAPPPAQPAGWAPGPGAPGGPPPGAWNPQPAKSSNGCLKACLIVGAILVVVGILGVIGISFLGMQIASDLGVNPDGSVKSCELITNDELSSVFGSPAQALPMGGFVDSTIGQLLDRRVLASAPDCWIVGQDETSTTGRMARQDGGDASGDFASAKQAAQGQGYFAGDLSGYGDEAFCTGMSEAGSFGALVRAGGSLAYVGLIDPEAMQGDGLVIDENGGVTSPVTCERAARIAVALLR